MEIHSLTDIGVSRKDNQDNYWSARLEVNGFEAGVMCLCDGMGGLEEGALVSRMVIERVRDYFTKSIDISGLEDEIRIINDEILNLSEGKGKYGTTCTVLICYKGVYRVLHIGDSRCYKVSEEGIPMLLTKDHSVIAEYRRRGIELPDNLRNKYKNSLTKCIGVTQNISFDKKEGIYEKGTIFVVCSDGLWHYFDNCGFNVEDLSDLSGLIGKCIDSGETDNISIGVLRI